MGGKKSTPKAPDFTALAEQTAQSSKEATTAQTYANRANQHSPGGDSTWEASSFIDPATGQKVTSWDQYIKLSPESQRAFDAQQSLTAGKSELAAGMMDRISDEFGNPIDYSQFGAKGGKVNATGKIKGKLGGADAYMGKAGDALMSQFTDRMNPQFARAEAQQDAILRARGLMPGDESYNQALADLRQGQGDQFNSAMYQAQQLSAQEADRLQGMDQQSMDAFNNAIKSQLGIDLDLSKFMDYQRNRDVTEENIRRNQSLNETNAIISGAQVAQPNMPGYNTASKSETTDYSGAGQAQYGAAMDKYNAQQDATAGMVGAITAPFSMAIPS